MEIFSLVYLHIYELIYLYQEQVLSYQEINQEKEPLIFENSKSEKKIEAKEPEMFEEHNLEEDFEIPAFLRRQKN